MSEKNQKNLSEYLMLNRPALSDLYAIYDSLFRVLISEGHGENIVFNAEYIYYDRKRKKIRFKKNNSIRVEPYSEVLRLLEYIRCECRYAGGETCEFVDGISELYKKTYKNDKELMQCRLLLEKYKKKDGIGYGILLFTGVAAVELILRVLS